MPASREGAPPAPGETGAEPSAGAEGADPGAGRERRFVHVGSVRFDRIEGRLSGSEGDLSVRSKSLAVLRHLVANAGRVVSRSELLRSVWAGRSVSPSVVRVSVRELREALGSGVIETVGRQGYRFDADIAGVAVAAPTFVGRDAELARLYELFERCRKNQPRIAFVAGEAGIGKSALIERFAAAIAKKGTGPFSADIH